MVGRTGLILVSEVEKEHVLGSIRKFPSYQETMSNQRHRNYMTLTDSFLTLPVVTFNFIKFCSVI